MYQIYCFETQNRRELIKKFYERESGEWHEEVHENGGSLEENIEDTLKSIEPESVMYEVLVEHESAAWFSKYVDEFGNIALVGFHVMPEFRTKDFLIGFWKKVKEVMGNVFWVGVFDRNETAVKHLAKQGFELYKVDNHRDQKILIFKSS